MCDGLLLCLDSRVCTVTMLHPALKTGAAECVFMLEIQRRASHHTQVEQLIQSTLEELAQTGFSSSSIEAALNTTEFLLRENNTGRFPRGWVCLPCLPSGNC